MTVTVHHHQLHVSTTGHGDVVDLSAMLREWLTTVTAVDGQVTLHVPGSTAAITTIELEPGAVADLDAALETIAPSDRTYHHDRRWGDGNGFSHLRAALLGPSLCLPVVAGSCLLGTWQQAVLVECDRRPRERRVALVYVGEVGGR